jgi:hypothetical protein
MEAAVGGGGRGGSGGSGGSFTVEVVMAADELR